MTTPDVRLLLAGSSVLVGGFEFTLPPVPWLSVGGVGSEVALAALALLLVPCGFSPGPAGLTVALLGIVSLCDGSTEQ